MTSSSIPIRLDHDDPVLATRDVDRRFGSIRALEGVDLTVPRGGFYVLAGPNGAGKTTLMKILTGLLTPDQGMVEVRDGGALDPVRRGGEVRALIGFVPERAQAAYGWLRVRDLFRHEAAYRRTWDADYAARLAAAFDLPLDRRLRKLSKGQVRRAQIVLALAHRPPILLLDEPTGGLDPTAREIAASLIAEHLAETPTTVFAATHHLHEMERFADHLGVLRDGRMKAQVPVPLMKEKLSHYTMQVPDGWNVTPELVPSVLRRNGGGRELRWMIWGDRGDVVGRLGASGATVRDASPVSLDEAALALLLRRES